MSWPEDEMIVEFCLPMLMSGTSISPGEMMQLWLINSKDQSFVSTKRKRRRLEEERKRKRERESSRERERETNLGLVHPVPPLLITRRV